MKKNLGIVFAMVALISMSVFGVSSSLNSRIHANLINGTGDPHALHVSFLFATFYRQGYYDPTFALKRALEQGTLLLGGTSELTSLTEITCVLAFPMRPRTALVAMDDIARVDGPGQFDITR